MELGHFIGCHGKKLSQCTPRDEVPIGILNKGIVVYSIADGFSRILRHKDFHAAIPVQIREVQNLVDTGSGPCCLNVLQSHILGQQMPAVGIMQHDHGMLTFLGILREGRIFRKKRNIELPAHPLTPCRYHILGHNKQLFLSIPVQIHSIGLLQLGLGILYPLLGQMLMHRCGITEIGLDGTKHGSPRRGELREVSF